MVLTNIQINQDHLESFIKAARERGVDIGFRKVKYHHRVDIYFETPDQETFIEIVFLAGYFYKELINQN